MNKKIPTLLGITIILVLTIIFIGGIIVYQYYWESTPAPTITQKDETADWETYRNEKCGFEIKYPKQLKTELVDNSVFIAYAPSGRKYMQIQVFGLTLSDKFPIEEQARWDIEYYAPWGAQFQKKVNVGGKEALFYSTEHAELMDIPSDDPLQNIPYRAYIIYLTDKLVKVQIGYFGGGEEQILFQKMITTFRFVEYNTSDWKIYRNDETGIEIKYPPGWYLKNQTKSCREFDKDCLDSISIQNMEEIVEGNGYREGFSFLSLEIDRTSFNSLEEWIDSWDLVENESSYRTEAKLDIFFGKIGEFEGETYIPTITAIPGMSYYFIQGGRLYRIGYFSYSEEIFNKDKEIFRNIIYTFKFID